MSSGTSVKVERYYNRHHYCSIAEIEKKIAETKKAQIPNRSAKIFGKEDA